MTNREALLAVLQDVSAPDLTLDKVLLDGNIAGGEAYVSGNAKSIDLCAIEVLYGIYVSPDISEGGFSVGHPDFLRKLKERLLYLTNKWGVTADYPGLTPTVRDATNRW